VLGDLRFEEGMTNGEDWLALAKILRKGHVSHAVPGGGATYRIHPKSAVMQDMLGHEAKLEKVIDWIYSSVPADEAQAKFTQGITTPSRKNVLFGRRLNQIVWCIFGGKINTALSLMTDSVFLTWLASDTRNFGRMIDVAYVRFYSRHVDTKTDIPPEDKRRMTEVLQYLEKIQAANRLVAAFGEKFGLAANTNSIREANLLYREKRYSEALAVYRKLQSQRGIHLHLDANISACERKIRLG
jgi:hypothetical protein